jgi:hypothetical protein
MSLKEPTYPDMKAARHREYGSKTADVVGLGTRLR